MLIRESTARHARLHAAGRSCSTARSCSTISVRAHKFEPGLTVTHQECKLESPYWLIMLYILGPLLKKRSIDLDLQGHLQIYVKCLEPLSISQERIDRLTSDENFFD